MIPIETGGVIKGLFKRSEHFNAFRRHHPVRIGKSGLRTEGGNLQVPGGSGLLSFLLSLEVIAFALSGGATLDQVPLVPVVRRT